MLNTMLKKLLKIEIIIVIAIALFIGIYHIFSNIRHNYYLNIESMEDLEYDTWYKNNKIIVHATGMIDSLTYTNSKESIEHSINNGAKIIEVDFGYTSDGHIVCYHMPSDVHITATSFTLDEFLHYKIQGKYTPITLNNIIEYMKSNPELYISIDTKHDKLTELIKDITMLCHDENILNRFIIQCFYPGEKEQIAKIYDFPEENYMFAPYKYSTNPYTALKVCYEENFHVLAAPVGAYSEEMLKLMASKNIYVYLHTVNRIDILEELFRQGTHGVYSDYIFSLE